MQTFISETVEKLYSLYGDDISKIKILFPGRRASLFFTRELAKQLNGKPIWRPEFLSVDTLAEKASGLRSVERLRLVAELYEQYQRFHPGESFDRFFYWGEMLISDFDSVDNYMVDADRLFVNIGDLHEIDSLFEYLSDEQLTAIKRFWNIFRKNNEDYSSQQKVFLSIWNSLLEIYTSLRKSIADKGFGYKGMIYRAAAENLKKGASLTEFAPDTVFAVIGFNALSPSEKIIFRHLRDNYTTHFFWDNDDYYTTDKNQEAGLFIRENIREFPETNITLPKSNFVQHKNITVVSSPSLSLQSRYVWLFLQKLAQDAASRGETLGRETAVVLTNEALLLQVIHSIPPAIEAFNVTSGYNLSLTPAYSIIEYLTSLQRGVKIGSGGESFFYHKDVKGILSHPYMQLSFDNQQRQTVAEITKEINSDGVAYIDNKKLCRDQLSTDIFTPQNGREQLTTYLLSHLERVLPVLKGNDREYLLTAIECLNTTNNVVESCNIDMSEAVYLSSLRRALKSTKVTFEGEPLVGVQVMGILETRGLDFKNVLILSLEDDNFPGNLIGSSYIPGSLRFGYGLPTEEYKVAMYSYYFYRLMQRAENIEIVYCSKSDGMGSGEASRFVHQLRLESPHDIINKSISLQVSINSSKKDSAEKDERIMTELFNYIDGVGHRALSPSAIYTFVECPYRFYLKYLEGIAEPEEVTETVDYALLGTVMHKILEELYGKFLNCANAQELLRNYLPTLESELPYTVDRLIADILKISPGNFDNSVIISKRFIINYIKNIVRYDIERSEPFKPLYLEKDIRGSIEVNIEGEPVMVSLRGTIDRVDELADGTLRIIDYKSGKSFSGLKTSFETLFEYSPQLGDRKAVAQTLIYSMLLSEQEHRDVSPMLYFAREMHSTDYLGSPIINKDVVLRYSQVSDSFQNLLQSLLERIFASTLTFDKSCNKCPYKC